MNLCTLLSAKKIGSVLAWLLDGYWPCDCGVWQVRVESSRLGYTLQNVCAAGDIADIYFARCADDQVATEGHYLLKIARLREGNAHLEIERKHLSTLLRAAGDTTYRKYLPALVESFSAADGSPRWINVFRYQPGFHTL